MIVNDIRNRLIAEYQNENFVIDKTGVKTIELVNASFDANEPFIFGAPNDEYIQNELAWYMSQSLNVNDIPGGPPKIWQEVADKGGIINSNYGYLIFSEENHSQFTRVLDELILNPLSRRAVMIYQRPTMHKDYCENGRSDFICTNAVQYLIRSDVLHAVVQMRSNDVVFGYRNDYAWQKYVCELLKRVYEKRSGHDLNGIRIHWNVGSLHLYERHFKFVEKAINEIDNRKAAKELADIAFGNYVRNVSEHYEI